MNPIEITRWPITVNGTLYSQSIMVEMECNTKQEKEKLVQYCNEKRPESRFMLEDEDIVLVLIK